MLFFALNFFIFFLHVDSDGMIDFYAADNDKDGSTDILDDNTQIKHYDVCKR